MMIDTELLYAGAATIIAISVLVRAIGYTAEKIIWAKRRDPRKP